MSCWLSICQGWLDLMMLVNYSHLGRVFARRVMFKSFIAFLQLQVNGSLLPASVISVYCAYLCYSGLSSEPRDYACNGLHNHSKSVSIGTLVLGMLTTVLSVVYSAVRAGSSTTFLSPPSSPKTGTSTRWTLSFVCFIHSMHTFPLCLCMNQHPSVWQ